MSTRDEVTDILNRLRGLLGEGTPVTAPLPSTIPADIQTRLDALPNGLGNVIERFVQSRKSQADITAELAKVDPSLVPVVDESATNALAGRDAIDQTQTNYSNQRDALAPIEGTPMGQMAVLQSKVNALGNGAESVRAQMPPAELRRVLVDELANRYYQQAKTAAQGMASTGPGSRGMSGSPMSAMGGSPMGASASPLSALSGLSSAPASALSAASSAPAQLMSAMSRNGTRTPQGALPPEVGSERGLQVKTILAARAISAAFPEITDIGGVRPDSLKWHPNGLAIDVMIPNSNTPEGRALGDRVLAFTMAHAKQFGLNHAIWRQTMYTQGSAPRLMEDRGSPTQNHMDHVHIATDGGGYPTGGETYVL